MYNLGYSMLDMIDNVLDRATVQRLRDTIGEDAFLRFLNRFFEDCAARTARINDAYHRNQFSEVELEAHTLGTAAATYGAAELEAICREIEFAKPSKDNVFQERIDRLNLLSEESIQALRDYMDGAI